MLLLNARRNSQGFTLIETVIILMIIGILSAIAAPSFLGLLNRGKVNNAVAQVQGALQEAQREAIRRSKPCSVTLTTTTVTSNCLVTGDRTLPDGVAMATNVDGSIQFGIQGNTKFTFVATSPAAGTGNIILYQSNGPASGRKCVAVSKGIGILRSGTYPDGDSIIPASISTTCKQSE